MHMSKQAHLCINTQLHITKISIVQSCLEPAYLGLAMQPRGQLPAQPQVSAAQGQGALSGGGVAGP